MRIICLALVLALCLCGCGAQQTVETVTDEIITPVVAMAQEVNLALPEGASMEVAEAEDTGKLYLCENYTVAVQTLEAGDLDKTLRTVTGYGREDLTLMQRRDGAYDRYECVWAAAGEGQEQVGRTLVLDDGSYHYTVTVMAPASQAGELTEDWRALMSSVRLGADINTGS